jgi:inorganic pyrophosphatase
VPVDTGVERNPAEFEVLVEIPRGSRNKYEVDHETGDVWLDRRLFTAMAYPADYGYIVGSLGEDGDPLDVLVLLDEPTFPGCHLLARAVGVFWMRDDAGPDAKVLAVPARDLRYSGMKDLEDLPPYLLDEIRHFFEAYKQLEPGKFSEVREWEGRASAEAEIAAAFDRAVSSPQ